MWHWLDETLNNFANWLYFRFNNDSLSKRFQSNIVNSPKDRLIYSEIEEKYYITPFEKRVLELEAYRPGFIPNNSNILDHGNYESRKEFLKQTGLDLSDLKMNMEEIIHLHSYKKDDNNIKRMKEIDTYYHKQHFLMSIGIRRTPHA